MRNPRRDGDAFAVLAPYTALLESKRSRVRVAALSIGCLLAFFVFGLCFPLLAPNMLLLCFVPVLGLSLLVIWALPASNWSPERLLDRLLFSFLVALVLWPNYLAIALPGLPWITLTRLIGLPLVVVLLVGISVSTEFVTKLKSTLASTQLISGLLALFVVIQLVSIAFSHNAAFSINKFVVAQLGGTAVYLASCSVFLRPGRVQLFAVLIWLMAIVVGCIALWESARQQVPWAGHIPSFLKIDDPDVQEILVGMRRSAIDLYRVQSTFSTCLGLAEYIALAIPFVLYFAVEARSWLVRLAATASAPFLVYVTLLTDSRFGIIGCLSAFLLYLLFWGTLRWRRQKDNLFGPAISLAYPVFFWMAISATLFVGKLHARVWGNGYEVASNQSRMEQITKGLPLVAAHPWGYGIGMAASTLGIPSIRGGFTIDNYYLSVALDYGALGFVVYYGILLLGITRAIRLAFQEPPTGDSALLVPIAIALMNFVAIKSVFSQEGLHPLVFMMLGIVAALTARSARDGWAG